MTTPKLSIFTILALLFAAGLTMAATARKESPMSAKAAPDHQLETITLGGGCFWCLEAVFDELDGVRSVESGYSGGSAPSPTYKQVCSGTTGHAEVIQIIFDPMKIQLADLLRIFFTLHDPTTKDRQGNDAGTQYRSIILYRGSDQERIAREVLKEIESKKVWDRPIVTEIVPFLAFYRAEDYHQQYYANNASQGYCRVVIEPKVAKLRKMFRDRLKTKSDAPH